MVEVGVVGEVADSRWAEAAVRVDVVEGAEEEAREMSGVAACVAGVEVNTAIAAEEGEEVREGARSKIRPHGATTRTTTRITAIAGVEDRSPLAEDVTEETGNTMVEEAMADSTPRVVTRPIVGADKVKATLRISVHVATVKTAVLTGTGITTDTKTSLCPLASRALLVVVTAVRRRRVTVVPSLISRSLVLRFESSLGLGAIRLRSANPLSRRPTLPMLRSLRLPL